MARLVAVPVLFVFDRDPDSLDGLLSDLSRRFGNNFTVSGETSPQAAHGALQEMAAARKSVALLLVDDAASDLLAQGSITAPASA